MKNKINFTFLAYFFYYLLVTPFLHNMADTVVVMADMEADTVVTAEE